MALKHDRLVPLIVAVALFMENMDSTVISTSLPAIAADIGTSPLALKLAVTCYLLSLAIFIPASGWTADRFAARTVFRAAIAVFVVGSIGCAFASSLTGFVIARIVQGMGGAMMTPVGRLVLVRTVDRRALVDAMVWVTLPALIGPVIGPPVGGFITTYFSWHWIFLINVPIGLVGIALVTRYIENIRAEAPEPFDFLGMFLAGLGVGGLAFGLSVLGLDYLPWWLVAALIGTGAVATAAYVAHARRTPSPVLDLTLFAVPTFRAGAGGGFLFRIGVGAIPFLLPLLLQLGFGLTPFQSGLITFCSALGAMTMKACVTPILRQFAADQQHHRQCRGQRRLPRGLRDVHARHADPGHDGGAAGRRLLPLARVHQSRRHHLRRRRAAARRPRHGARQRRPAAVALDRRRHGGARGRPYGAAQGSHGNHGERLCAGFSFRRRNLGPGGADLLAPAARRRRRACRPHAGPDRAVGSARGMSLPHVVNVSTKKYPGVCWPAMTFARDDALSGREIPSPARRVPPNRRGWRPASRASRWKNRA